MYQPKFTSRGEHSKSMLSRCGYKSGGAVSDEASKDVHKHESHLHKGEPKTKLATGGAVEGFASGGRLDKMARGGRHKHKAHTKITIVNAPQQGGALAPMPIPVPPPGPMAGPPPGMMPPGMPMHKSGGKVAPHMTGGAASGVGREQKAAIQKAKGTSR